MQPCRQSSLLLIASCWVLWVGPVKSLRRIHVKMTAPTTETLLPFQDDNSVDSFAAESFHAVRIGSAGRTQMFPRRFVKKLSSTAPTTTEATSSLEPMRCEEISEMAIKYGIQDIRGFAKQNCFLIRMYMPHVTCDQINVFVDFCFG
ncbi:hypothetical protein L596_012928 [Steinernema carpocapsae]|uniref:aECM cysteine-cradle domain-containing protein n=1 Tax=Steinernema carpocapsae TaxID=34508 RepID=A0A4U5NYP4_STECR|nr:hypothetical protein L596_012928 [Steinernema carpocapsae]